MATTMEAAVLREFGGDFAAEERPVPEPGPGEVLVKVLAVGAGLTLEHIRMGRMGGQTPRVMGHELAGTVEDVGVGVTGWERDTLVTATFYLLCGSCVWCVSGRETLCDAFGGFVGTATDGAFAEYVVLPAHNLVRVPDGVSPAQAGVVADAVATPYHAVAERLRPRPGDAVAVIGAGGGLGVHVLAMLRAFGVRAVGVETDESKAAEIVRRGLADGVVSDLPAAREAAGGHLHGVIDTVGSSETLTAAASAVGKAGSVIALGFTPGASVTADPLRLISEEVVVTGTRYATRAEIAATLDLVAQGRVEPVIGATFPLSELNDAFSAIRDNNVLGRVVIDVAGER